MSVIIPVAETVKISELKTDGENPNKMSKEQLERLKASIKEMGFHRSHNHKQGPFNR